MICPNINTAFFKKLEKDFGYDDAWRIAYRTMQPKFDKWYGNGKRDKLGNPRIYSEVFQNGKGSVYRINEALNPTEEEKRLWMLGSQTQWESQYTGIPSQLSKAQWAHVRTESFIDWFGDWQNNYQNIKGAMNEETGEPSVVEYKGNRVFINDTENINGTSIKSAVANNGEYSNSSSSLYDSRLELKEAISKKDAEAHGKRLKNIFLKNGVDVDIIYDENMDKNADVTYLGNGKATIRINPNRVYKDTIPHEFSHLYIDMLGYEHPLVQQAIKQAKKLNPELWETIQEKYPDKNIIDQEKELLATSMGVAGSAISTDTKLQRAWTLVINKIMRAIGELFGRQPDFAKQLYLDMAFDKFNGGDFRNLVEGKTEDSRLEKIVKENSNVFLDESFEEPKYINIEDPSINYQRGTEVISGKKEDKEKGIKKYPGLSWKHELGNKTPEEYTADRIFKNQFRDPETEKVELTYNDEKNDYTYQELLDHLKIEYETGRQDGNISHLILEREIKKYTKEDSKLIDSINSKINKISKGKKGKWNPINLNSKKWLVNAIPSILTKAGINIYDEEAPESALDKLKAEVVLYSDILGVATTADSIVEHSDGSLSMFDWKAGKKFLSDAMQTNRELKYGDKVLPVYDTKLGRASLEVMLRAMIIKLQNPEARFRNLRVVHLNRNTGTNVNNVNIPSTLKALEDYYKKEHPEKYNALLEVNPDIFRANDYVAFSEDLSRETRYKDMSKKQIVEDKKNELFTLTSIVNKTPDDIENIKNLSVEILNMEGDAGFKIDNSLGNEQEIGIFKRWFANAYSIGKGKNPMINQFFKNHLAPARMAAKEEIENIQREHIKKLIPVLKEYFASKGKTYSDKKIESEMSKVGAFVGALAGAATGLGGYAMLAGNIIGGISTNIQGFSINYGELYSFMYSDKNDLDKDGIFLKTEEEIPEGMSTAKREYLQYIKNTMQEQWGMTMSKTVFMDETNEEKYLWEVLGQPEKLDEDFMPRVPMPQEEFLENQSLLSGIYKLGKNEAKIAFNKHFNEVNNNEVFDEHATGIPLKYMGNTKIVQGREHTLNTEIMFNNFINNLVMKRHMDSVHAVGKGVITLMEAKKHPNGKKYFKQAIGFLEDQMSMHVLGKTSSDLEKNWKIKIPHVTFKDGKLYTIPGKYTYINISKFMNTMKSFTSAITMWLKPIGGAANTILITMLTVKDGLKGSIAKRLGVPIEDIDFTLSDLWYAEGAVLNYWKDHMTGKGKENKLHLLMKKYDFLPKNMDYTVEGEELYSGKNKLFNTGNLFVFHQLGEEWGNLILLAAQMRRMKHPVTGKSILDSYEVEDGKLVWKGGERFTRQLSDGTIKSVTELEPEEVTRLKKITARIHGGYRREERVALELTAVGKWVLQFKKYLPAVLENALMSRMDDTSLGKFKKVEGQDIYEWISMQHEGRIWTTTKVLASMIAGKAGADHLFNEYRWIKGNEKLTSEDKKNVISVGISMTLWIIMTLGIGAAFDDDDDPWKWRFENLAQNMTQDYNFLDWLKALVQPTVVIGKLLKGSEGLSDMFWKGLIQGERVKSGPNKGKFRGTAQFRKNWPLFSSTEEWDRMVIDYGNK